MGTIIIFLVLFSRRIREISVVILVAFDVLLFVVVIFKTVFIVVLVTDARVLNHVKKAPLWHFRLFQVLI